MTAADILVGLSIAVAALTVAALVGRALFIAYRSLGRIEASMIYVESEMNHNGGETLRDHIVTMTDTLDTHIAEQTADFGCVSRRLDSIDSELSTHIDREKTRDGVESG